MKINKSIFFQLFFTMLLIFLVFLVAQTFFLSKLFTPFYSNSMLSDIRSEFKTLTKQFTGGGEETVNAALRGYTIKYQAPVLVITSDYRIKDRYFFDQMSMLMISDRDAWVYKVPVENIDKLSNANIYQKLRVEAMRFGNSSYYEPLLIESEDRTYLIRQINSAKTGDRITIDGVRRWYSQQGGGKTEDRAHLIYDLVKDCMINHADIQKCLDRITESPFTDNTGLNYRIFSQSRSIDGTTYFFVTVRSIALTGTEARYFNKYFYLIFTILCLVLIAAVYIVSRRFSAPILKLSAVTKRLANQDFNVRAEVRSKNEVGQLSSDINLLADNLEKAIGELQQAAETAHLSEIEMKRLLADLAHEFKTPLGIISLYVEAIEKGMYGDDGQYFKIIEHEIENLTQMIDETIQLTKMQAGILEYKPAPVELNDLIDIALSRFSEELARENFTLEIHSLDVTVMADGRRIEQVLTNLISNAVKYSDEIRRIEVNVTRQDRTVTVDVSNYSHVSEENLKRIWERYYRAAEDNKTSLPSQGIGLEIVRGILKMHNSDFGVRQEAGKICFYFTLQVEDEYS